MVTLSINISAMNIKCIKKKCSKNEKTENILKNRSYINEARSKSRKIENPFDIDKSPTKKKELNFMWLKQQNMQKQLYTSMSMQ